MLSRQERVTLFMSLFSGRSNVFARRWQKWDGGIAGYSPVYIDRDKESYEPLSTEWIEKHLIGTVTLGVYPLLSDNTSQFIAADFDDTGWQDAVRSFAAVCTKHGVPVAVERSRSGNGAHAWVFFADPYPAYKSRRIVLTLLEEARCIDPLEKNDSFDRLFPNQDYLSGKGLGNLIAFPLQGESRKHGNAVFVDPKDDFAVLEDQWEYLSRVQRMSLEELDALYAACSGTVTDAPPRKRQGNTRQTRKKSVLALMLGRAVAIPKNILPPGLVAFLREELNILNIGYVVKERAGLPTFGEKRFINTLEQSDDAILMPRGFLGRLESWLTERDIAYMVKDERLTLDPVTYASSFRLFPYQDGAIAACVTHEQGVLVAPAGAGKTIMGLALIAQKKQPALILTHRRQIYEQWLEQVENGFGIPKRKIGQICSTKKNVIGPITVAMVQTLARMIDLSDITSRFGMILIDECHHMPAQMFRDVVSKFPARFRFGLTATPTRKYNDEKLIAAYLGETLHVVAAEDVRVARETPDELNENRDEVTVRTTQLTTPFGTNSRDFPLISKVLSNDAARNALIAEDIKHEAAAGKKCLVLTERKEHAEMLRAYLRKEFETILFSGDLSARQRVFAMQKIKSGRFKVLIATGQILGEGTDIDDLEVLFLSFPVSFHGKLAQYVGRIKRKGGAKKVYDYRDARVPILEKLWKKRGTFYRKSGFTIGDDTQLLGS
ncbi:DEAD/DEAH box helicase family protein [Candidatus Kaiserbacteria bacterium]|nr:DEAD/DEAH box helicase family protein [Candidatus Kaiserbacteria bacterium]